MIDTGYVFRATLNPSENVLELRVRRLEAQPNKAAFQASEAAFEHHRCLEAKPTQLVTLDQTIDLPAKAGEFKSKLRNGDQLLVNVTDLSQ